MNMAQTFNSVIRFGIWEYFKIHCQLFLRMDCNAQFSELFQKIVFSPVENLSVTEYKSLFSLYCHSGYCLSCEQQISINNEVLVNYITLAEMLHSSTPLVQWSNFIAQSNTLTRIQCPHYATICHVQTVRTEKELSHIMFVELSIGMINISKFRLQIRLADKEYRLVGLVKYLGMHFTSAVYNQYNSSWLYFHDLISS